LHGDELVWDLYTGVGTIAHYLAKKAQHVIGIEVIENAIEDAKANAMLNNIHNVSFYVGDMKDILKQDCIRDHGKPKLIVVDPPRAGMHPDVIQQLLEIEAEKIIYVSCNPTTQAKDISLLASKYTLEQAQPIDMFPHTSHVENVALLVKK
jgi:23S rRNA (uracil1939-C5)-methyltransferase